MSLEKATHVLANLYSYLSNAKDRRLKEESPLFMVKQQFDPIDLYYNLAKYFVHKNELDAYNFILQSLSEHKVGLTDWGLKDWVFYKSLASTSMHFVSKFIKPYIDAIEQERIASSLVEVLTEDQQTILTLIRDEKFSEAHALYKEASNKFLQDDYEIIKDLCQLTESLVKMLTYDIASRVLSSIPLHEDRVIVKDALFKYRDSITSSFT
jgi:hypothetical protein